MPEGRVNTISVKLYLYAKQPNEGMQMSKIVEGKNGYTF